MERKPLSMWIRFAERFGNVPTLSFFDESHLRQKFQTVMKWLNLAPDRSLLPNQLLIIGSCKSSNTAIPITVALQCSYRVSVNSHWMLELW